MKAAIINFDTKIEAVKADANNLGIAAAASRVKTVHWKKWEPLRNERWFEGTLPYAGEQYRKEHFRATPMTLRFVTSNCAGRKQ